MDLRANFSFRPLPAIASPVHLPFPWLLNPLGPLKDLPGSWKGSGFNTIWRPFFANPPAAEDEFLELNLTDETLDFTAISGQIPNRGFFQPDINMFGVTYMQQISDHNKHAGLHIEPGIWATVPQTSNPAEPPTVVRMALIPHGTTILAQGLAHAVNGAGGPSNAGVSLTFPAININPIKPDGTALPFEQQNLSHPTPFRSEPAQLAGITQAMVDNPNSVLAAAIQGQHIKAMTVLQVSTAAPLPITGGGTSNTSFLVGARAGPNADATRVDSTFWIETIAGADGAPDFLQLQYSQTVMLKFDEGILWPHVTVGTLTKPAAGPVSAAWIDPQIPASVLHDIQLQGVQPPRGG